MTDQDKRLAVLTKERDELRACFYMTELDRFQSWRALREKVAYMETKEYWERMKLVLEGELGE